MDDKTDRNNIEHIPAADMEGQEKSKVQGVDDTFSFAIAGSDVVWSDEEEKRVRWKIDLVILPLVLISFISFRRQSADRLSSSSAAW